MRKGKQRDLAYYQQFRAKIGVTTAELQELFAQEVLDLTRDERVIIEENDFYHPDTWNEEARAIYTKMLARAAVKAKRRGNTANTSKK